MPCRRIWFVPAFCFWSALLLPGAMTGASSPMHGPAFPAHLVCPTPRGTTRSGLPADSNAAHASNLRFDPMLLKLAGKGAAQNIRLLGDGTVSLLATGQAAQQLQARGSTLVPVARVASAGSSDQPLSGVISGTVSV